MEIKGFKKTDKEVTVEYSNSEGDYRIRTSEEPHLDLSLSIVRLQPALVRCMAMESLKDHVRCDGFSAGSDEVGNWYQLSGTYTAHLVAHKIKAPKIREVVDAQYWENKDIDQSPSFFTRSEQELMQRALEEVHAFILGKRGQLQLDEAGQEPEPFNDGLFQGVV